MRAARAAPLGAPPAQVRDLKTQARVFQNNRCSACQAPLDLPAVHFLCMHSFHQRCLGDNERECVKCAPENRTVMEIKRSLEASAADQARSWAETRRFPPFFLTETMSNNSPPLWRRENAKAMRREGNKQASPAGGGVSRRDSAL